MLFFLYLASGGSKLLFGCGQLSALGAASFGGSYIAMVWDGSINFHHFIHHLKDYWQWLPWGFLNTGISMVCNTIYVSHSQTIRWVGVCDTTTGSAQLWLLEAGVLPITDVTLLHKKSKSAGKL